jgi:DnaK suppressor protein
MGPLGRASRQVFRNEQTLSGRSFMLANQEQDMDNPMKPRDEDLRNMLQARRLEIRTQVQRQIRDARSDRAQSVLDDVESSGIDLDEDLEFSLIQFKSETLRRIDDALVRLNAGVYGDCLECEEPIAKSRLRAMPFAIRCTACQERHEQADAQAKQIARGHGRAPLLSDVFGF